MLASFRPRLLALAAFALALPGGGSAQEPPGRPGLPCVGSWGPGALGGLLAEERHARMIEGLDPMRHTLLRTSGRLRDEPRCGGREGIGPTPVSLGGTYNSGYPVDRNNGMRWAGRGISVDASAGVAGRFARGRASLEVAVQPAFAWAANDDVALAPTPANRSRFAYFVGGVDWPQRFGGEAWSRLAPGSSFLRLAVSGAAAGLSTENQWWGPAQRYPLMLSNTAEGFPHVFLETDGARATPLGRIDARVFWGRLDESDFFDANSRNDDRLLGGVLVAYSPPGGLLEGLTLGASLLRHAYVPDEGLSLGDLTDVVTPLLDDANDDANVLGSLSFRWVLAGSGFEAYGEWGRDDYADTLEDFLREPDHARAFSLGLRKTFDDGGALWRLGAEIAHLKQSVTTALSGRARATFYLHSTVTQGHTHLGQLLGAAIGPGSDARYLALDRFSESGSLGGFLEWIRWNDDFYLSERAERYGFHGHDLELTAGLRGMRRAPAGLPLAVEWLASWSIRQNRDFIQLDGVRYEFDWTRNIQIDLRAVWRP